MVRGVDHNDHASKIKVGANAPGFGTQRLKDNRIVFACVHCMHRHVLPVVPHTAVAEVSIIGNL